MFTGLIEEIGTVNTIKKGIKSSVITINAKKILEGVKIGDSIAVDGVCLTVSSKSNTTFTADIMSETLNRSTLSNVRYGKTVNLERALLVSGRFGGHIVSGHIDGIGTILASTPDDNAVIINISAKSNILDYVVEKGSIAIDGISLTVTYVDAKCFSVSIIPHTAYETTLADKSVGDNVNLECDIVGKYIEKFLHMPKKKNSNVDTDFLTKHGFC